LLLLLLLLLLILEESLLMSLVTRPRRFLTAWRIDIVVLPASLAGRF
jgi:hypothetical protein